MSISIGSSTGIGAPLSQPLSMVNVDPVQSPTISSEASRTNDDDLAQASTQKPTLHKTTPTRSRESIASRFRETSERKLQLIKQLLTPEQFESVAAEFAYDEPEDQDAPINTSSYLSNEVIDQVDLGGSESFNLYATQRGQHKGVIARRAKRREAIEFFFGAEGESKQDELSPSAVGVSIRSNHRLSSIRRAAIDEKDLLSYPEFSLFDRLVGFLGWLQLDTLLARFMSTETNAKLPDDFSNYMSSFDNVPYNRTNNVLTMYDRLRANNQCDQIMQLMRSHDTKAQRSRSCSERNQTDIKASQPIISLYRILVPLSSSKYLATARFEHYMLDSSTALERYVLRLLHSLSSLTNFRRSTDRTHDETCEATSFEKQVSNDEERRRQMSLINRVHNCMFEVAHDLDDTECKISRLVNHVDPIDLALALSRRADSTAHKMRRRFILDPFVELMPRDAQRNSARLAMLKWRWTNKLLAPRVAFNEVVTRSTVDENSSRIEVQPEEFKRADKNAKPSDVEPASGFRFIEARREMAVRQLNDLERMLKSVPYDSEIKTESSMPPDDNNDSDYEQEPYISEILREPRLARTHIDMSGFLQGFLLMIPESRLRRPLMPQCDERFAGLSNVLRSRLRSANDAELDLESNHTRPDARHKSSTTLIVTVQRAHNVPMRIVPHGASMPASTRPNSPLGVAELSSRFMQQQQQLQSGQLMSTFGQQNYLLVSPTSYVEIVCKREQRTTSLAYGEQPAWNETLFVPVQMSSATRSLDDQSVHFNLYGYHCEPMAAAAGRAEQQQLPAARVMVAARQRIERHLLGSMRVPLATLVAQGHVEGSFALEQPLFLDEYQFVDSMQLGSVVEAGAWPARTDGELRLSFFAILDPPPSPSPTQVRNPILASLQLGPQEGGERALEYARLWEQIMSLQRHSTRVSLSPALVGGARPAGKRLRWRRAFDSVARHSGGGGGGTARYVRALVVSQPAADKKPQLVLACRLLGPLQPPANLFDDDDEGNETTTDNMDELARSRLARYVSLMRPVKYGPLQERALAPLLWFNAKQLVDLALGGPEERAVLLCNYLLHEGTCAALLLGDTMPSGRCVYVLEWMQQIAQRSSGGGATSQQQQQQQPRSGPIEAANFLARLPILIQTRTVRLWDASSGRCYALTAGGGAGNAHDAPHDVAPLISVGSLITCENVYANVQLDVHANRLDYDIRRANMWAPLLATSSSSGGSGGAALSLSHRKLVAQLDTMRRALEWPVGARVPLLARDTRLDYAKLTQDECSQLAAHVERTIKAQLLRWRRDRPTYFNRTLGRSIAQRLASFERRVADSCAGHLPRSHWRAELADIIRNEVLVVAAHADQQRHQLRQHRQVVSWPAQMAYTNTRDILDALHASGVHDADVFADTSTPIDGDGNDTKSAATHFIVACHVHAYPAHIASLWLYVAALVSKPRDSSSSSQFD